MNHIYPEKNTHLSGYNEIEFDAELMVSRYDRADAGDCPKAPFKFPGFGILLIKKGRLSLKINFVEHVLNYRDMLWILPGDIYEFSEEPSASVLCSFFNKDYLAKKHIFFNIADNYSLFSQEAFIKFSLSKSDYKLVLADMMALQARLAIPRTTRLVEEIIHNSFLSVVYDVFLINENQRKLTNSAISSKIELTNRFLSLVAEEFKFEKRVIYYANCLRITSRHLSQVVKQVTGKSAGEHIDQFVIREAKLLLSSHNLNISEIAELLSFSNPSFFGKFFKKRTGFSPISYKRANVISS